jgi:hypothetical protein
MWYENIEKEVLTLWRSTKFAPSNSGGMLKLQNFAFELWWCAAL